MSKSEVRELEPGLYRVGKGPGYNVGVGAALDVLRKEIDGLSDLAGTASGPDAEAYWDKVLLLQAVQRRVVALLTTST